MAATLTKSTIATLNTDQTFTKVAATSTTTNESEVFTLTPTAAGGKLAMVFQNTSTSAYTYSIAAGDFWNSSAITGSIAAGTVNLEVLQAESSRIMQDDGTIAITLTPATGLALVAGHAAAMYALQLK
jgi:hypothetical protein